MVAGGLLGKTSSFWGAFDLGEGGGCDASLLWLKQRSHCTPVPCIHADPWHPNPCSILASPPKLPLLPNYPLTRQHRELPTGLEQRTEGR